MKWFIYNVLILSVMLGLPTAVPAQTPFQSLGQNIEQNSGTINSLDLKQGIVIIDDMRYILGSKTSIPLREGMTVNFQFTKNENQFIITNIWLPEKQK